MTQFATELVRTPSGPLHLDGNSKITCEDGTYDEPIANAFSLPHISTCPGSTSACREGCYVHGLAQTSMVTYETYRRNETTIHRALMSRPSADQAAAALALHIQARRLTRFRWHVSGDVFSRRYATWILRVCELAPGTQFWIYTRSLPFVPLLCSAVNLTVNVSADADNLQEARAAHIAAQGRTNLCYFAREGEQTPPDADVVFPDYPVRGRDLEHPTDHPWWQALSNAQRRAVCPADFFGQSTAHRCGPCRKCL